MRGNYSPSQDTGLPGRPVVLTVCVCARVYVDLPGDIWDIFYYIFVDIFGYNLGRMLLVSGGQRPGVL